MQLINEEGKSKPRETLIHIYFLPAPASSSYLTMNFGLYSSIKYLYLFCHLFHIYFCLNF